MMTAITRTTHDHAGLGGQHILHRLLPLKDRATRCAVDDEVEVALKKNEDSKLCLRQSCSSLARYAVGA